MKTIAIVVSLLFTIVLGQECGSVMYWVDCSKPGISITYENESGNTEQMTISSKMWTKSIDACPGDFVYVSAQAKSKYATVEVKIIFTAPQRWETIEEATSRGDYVIATASGIIPK